MDVVFSITSAITTMVAVADPESEYRGLSIGSGIVSTVVHGVSAVTGIQWSAACRRAIAEWNAEGGSGDSDEEERRRLRREIERSQLQEEEAQERAAERAEARRRQEARVPVSPSAMRGFFCASSPTMTSSGLCTRQKVDCSRARAATIAAVPDLGECVLVENGYCFDAGSGNPEEICAPAEEACFAQQRATPGAGECVIQD